ncbi:FkbM family methyltransferase [Rhizorhabdus sp.]|uniref:FkbM family methyltransferase n=1 Tax=Rhizorhabdus sp. TaxID=1968843 RepID=UPI0035AF820F
MNLQEGVIWAYRLILNREATEEEIANHVAGWTSAQDLRRALRRSREWTILMDRAGKPFQERHPVDWHEGVLWAFRLLLRREPSAEEAERHLVHNDSVNALRLRLLATREFEVGSSGSMAMLDFAIVNAFAPFPDLEPVEGAFRDMLGAITRVAYLGQGWHGRAGYVFRSVPRDREPSLHGTSEWVGTLRSVLEARDRFTAVELGAGWGPWLIASRQAALARGFDDERIELIGVEGSSDHHAFMLDNFRTNGLDPSRYRLYHAVAGAKDGVASFPKLHAAEDDYGAFAAFGDEAVGVDRMTASQHGELEEIPCISLDTLLADHERVDLIHIDIQGHEEDVIRAGMETLNAKARRMVVGTHSRAIEGHLFDLFHANGWVCESEVPCVLRPLMDGTLALYVDGEQVWRNDRLDGAIAA